MQSCHAVGIMVSVCCDSGKPTSPDPLLLCHQIFGFALIRLAAAVYTTHPPASALHRPTAPSLSGCNARSSNGEQILLLYVPNSFSISSPTHLISSHAGFVGVLSHSRLSVHTGCSQCPRAREQCVRAQEESERWALPFPPAPPGGACAICLPTALSGCT